MLINYYRFIKIDFTNVSINVITVINVKFQLKITIYKQFLAVCFTQTTDVIKPTQNIKGQKRQKQFEISD